MSAQAVLWPPDPWTHDALAADLMDWRHKCGDIAVERLGLGQADVVAMRPSWTTPKPTIYEVKVTRQDLLSDLRKRKWERYFPLCERLIFAMPKGLAEPEEIPRECGIVLRGPNGWYPRRRAPCDPLTPDALGHLCLAILMRLFPSGWDGPNRMRRNLKQEVRNHREIHP